MIIKEFKCYDPTTRTLYDYALPRWNGCIEVWENNIPQTKTIILEPIADKEPILLQKIIIPKEFDPFILKKDVELCEGDILKGIPSSIDLDYIYGIIKTNIYAFRIEIFKDYTVFLTKGDCIITDFIRECWNRIEIVGNIYSNPDLLIS